ncbi:MAG: serine hydrolase domain-containing protein [Candidatus Aminicenantes bacterium]|jgi:CubicO group peptidase (beta-lactamase class C family)
MKNRLKYLSIHAFFILLCLSLAASAVSVEFPDTPAGHRGKEIVSLLNGEFSRSAEEYIQNDYAPAFRDAFPLATHMQVFTTTKTMFGRLALADVSRSTATQISITLHSESRKAWLNVCLSVEDDPPHRITIMGIRPGSRPTSLDKEERVSPEYGKEKAAKDSTTSVKKPIHVNPEELHKMISAKAENNEFAGVVLIARDGRPLFHRAYGYASKRFKVQNRLDTKFNLGSINKSFTAVAVTQLAEQGKLSLDDPIGKYLDIFPPEIAGKVTIRHLLNMRSGWGDFWGNETYLARFSRLRTVSDYMEFIKDMPLDFEPGTNFQHSNTGFDVAGAIIEAVTGQDYFDYVKKNIFVSAGMANSDSYHKDGPVENLAVGYTNMNRNDAEGTGYRWDNTYMMPPRGTPAGGGYSTAEDLLKYSQALRNHQLLSKPFNDFLFNRFNGKPGDPYIPKGMYRMVGGAPGINAYLGIDFVTGFTFIILSNYDHPAAVNLAQEIIKMYGLN